MEGFRGLVNERFSCLDFHQHATLTEVLNSPLWHLDMKCVERDDNEPPSGRECHGFLVAAGKLEHDGFRGHETLQAACIVPLVRLNKLGAGH